MTHAPISIAAGDVKPGDLLYDSGAYHPSAAWVRVRRVSAVTDSVKLVGYVSIETDRWTTYKHAREGISVRREVTSHTLVNDATSSGRPRVTCTACNAALVRQPWMSDVRWLTAYAQFTLDHPEEPKS